jgi:quinol monooxygenase YgiN
MHTLTAIIRARKGSEALVYAELLKVGAHAREYEPTTIGYFVTQDLEDPCVFTTYERYTDKAAMEMHSNGAGAQEFFVATSNHLDGEVIIVIAKEIWP